MSRPFPTHVQCRYGEAQPLFLPNCSRYSAFDEHQSRGKVGDRLPFSTSPVQPTPCCLSGTGQEKPDSYSWDAQPVEDEGFEDDVMKIMVNYSICKATLYLKHHLY